jgi:hypothetical protein
MQRTLAALCVASCLGASAAPAANQAYDVAADPAYADGWQKGDDGGWGWGAGWNLAAGASRGYAIGTSTANGDGDTDVNGDIDSDGVSWSASSEAAGAVATATRRFDGALATGQVMLADVDFDPAGGAVVFALQTATGANRFRFATSPSGGTRLLDAGELDIDDDTGAVTLTQSGGSTLVTAGSPDTYTLVLTPGDGGAAVEFERTLAGDGGIDRIAFAVDAEGAVPRQAFLNQIFVPEPGAFAAAVSAGAALLAATRRRAR